MAYANYNCMLKANRGTQFFLVHNVLKFQTWNGDAPCSDVYKTFAYINIRRRQLIPACFFASGS